MTSRRTFQLQRCRMKTFKDWQFDCTKVLELDQILIAWNMQKACRRKPRFTCDDFTWTSHISVQWQQSCMNLTFIWQVDYTRVCSLDWYLNQILPLDSSDTVASEVITQTVYWVLRAWLRQIVFHVQWQELLFDDFKNSHSVSNTLNKIRFCHEFKVFSL